MYAVSMPERLVRFQQSGDLHFITCSCYERRPYLSNDASRALFELALERMRQRYSFRVSGYVIMPEHVHMLVSEPERGLLSKAMQAIKLSVAVQRLERPFWQARYYDFNVFSEKKRIEKLKYLHRNPVTRGLVGHPQDWKWSSFKHYATGEEGIVEIDSQWTAFRKEQTRS